LAWLDEVIAEVVVAGQPDTAVDDGEFAAEAAEVQGLAEGEALNGPVQLRIHHQSPGFGIDIIGEPPGTIQ
jgi:hypothetical protein